MTKLPGSNNNYANESIDALLSALKSQLNQLSPANRSEFLTKLATRLSLSYEPLSADLDKSPVFCNQYRIWWRSLDGEPLPENEHDYYRYTLIQKLGAGGFGNVFLAMDNVVQRKVVLKILNESASENPELLKRFQAEMLTAATLEHPNIARIYELGFEDQRAFAVMEYVDGNDLRSAIVSIGKFNIAVIRSIFIELCKALDYIHRKGFVHRDIKPENILYDKNGTTKLIDFGLLHRADKPISESGELLWGTPLYMAPEIIEGHNYDHRADIYSLGIIYYEMRTGNPPFQGSIKELFQNHLLTIPKLPSKCAPNISEEEDRIIMRCLEKHPDDRYETVNELVSDLLKLDYKERYGYEENNKESCSIYKLGYCTKNIATVRTLIPLINASGSKSNVIFENIADHTLRELGYEPVRMGQHCDSIDEICRFCQLSSSCRAVICNLSKLNFVSALQLGMCFGNQKRFLLLKGSTKHTTFLDDLFPIKNFKDELDLARSIRHFIRLHDKEIEKTSACFFRWEYHCPQRPILMKKPRILIAIPGKSNGDQNVVNEVFEPAVKDVKKEPLFLTDNLGNLTSPKQIHQTFCVICKSAIMADSAVIDLSKQNLLQVLLLGIMIGSKKKILLIHRHDTSIPKFATELPVYPYTILPEIIDAMHEHFIL